MSETFGNVKLLSLAYNTPLRYMYDAIYMYQIQNIFFYITFRTVMCVPSINQEILLLFVSVKHIL